MLRRAPCIHALLRTLATKGVEISGLDADNGQKEGAGAEGAEDGRPELARHRAAQP